MKFQNAIRPKMFGQVVRGLVFGTLLSFSIGVEAQAQTDNRNVKSKIQRIRVEITERGYQPSTLRIKRGIPARLTFVRRVEGTCTSEVVFPDYGISRKLPLNKTVVINLTPKKSGEFTFACGMNMVRGKLIVR